MTKVLVTGANGHLGYTITKLLSEKGYNVKAGVRDFSEEKTVLLKQLSNVEIVKCDILKQEEFEQAAQDVQGLFHIAAVFKFGLKNPEESIIKPSVEGALNALRIADKYNLKVVLTSSSVALGNNCSETNPLNESSWNTDSKIPYEIGKTKAEQEAWNYAKEHNINLVTINPVGIIGPYFNRNTPTTSVFSDIVKGKLPVIPPIGFSFVDVRDVALAHIAAFENSNAQGRYIVSYSKHDMPLQEVVALIHQIDPSIKVPKRKISKRMFILYARMLSLGSFFTRKPPQITIQQAKEYTASETWIDSSKVSQDLKVEPRPLEETFKDMISWIRERDISSA